MARFFISNNNSSSINVKTRVEEVGFPLVKYKMDNTINLLSFSKLCVENTNYYEINDDYIIAVGTYIYKENIDQTALRNILSDFDNNISEIRHNTIGNYAIVIKKNDLIYIFCDEYALFDVFYYNDGSTWIISNMLHEMQASLSLTINEFNLIEKTFQNTILNNETIFNEVSRLDGNQSILINLNNNNVEINTIDLPSINEDYDIAIQQIISNISYISKQISDNYGRPAICMTGGLDSRLSLAAFLNVGCKPKLLYGVGNTALTNTKSIDRDIVKLFSNSLGLEYNSLDWTTEFPFDKYWNEYFRKYGFLAEVYMSSKNIMDSLENIQENYLTFGYFGELYRNLPWIETNKNSFFTLDTFLDEYYLNPNLKHFVKKYEVFREHIKKKFQIICAKYNLDPERLRLEDNQFFLIEYRKEADSKMLNLINQMRFCSYVLSESHVIKHSFISVESKKDSKFLLDIISRLSTSILEIPIYSHAEIRKLSKKGDHLILEPSRRDRVRTIRRIASLVVPKDLRYWIRRSFINPDAKGKEENSESKIFRERANDIIKKSAFKSELRYNKIDNFDIRHLVKYTFYLEAIKEKNNA